MPPPPHDAAGAPADPPRDAGAVEPGRPLPYGYKRGQPYVWYHKRPRLGNRHCLYCGVLVGEGAAVETDREHLVARNFVPTGALAPGDFNLIFRACRACNADKAAAERHVSTVTLYTSPARADAGLDALARRKAGTDFHPRKRGVHVQDAAESFEVVIPFGPARFTFTLVGPPQLDEAHALLLASYHVQGLYSLVTSPDPRRSEGTAVLDPVRVRTLGVYGEQDWGNPQLLEFARRAAAWRAYAFVDTAGGHFKAVLRRRPEPPEYWFWGLEWNRATRLAGVIVEPDAGPDPEVAIAQALPPVAWRQMPGGRIREEAALRPEDDTLFSDSAAPEPRA